MSVSLWPKGISFQLRKASALPADPPEEPQKTPEAEYVYAAMTAGAKQVDPAQGRGPKPQQDPSADPIDVSDDEMLDPPLPDVVDEEYILLKASLALGMTLEGFPSDQWNGRLQKAVRNKRLICHPDKGGSSRAFEKVQADYHTATTHRERWKDLLNLMRLMESKPEPRIKVQCFCQQCFEQFQRMSNCLRCASQGFGTQTHSCSLGKDWNFFFRDYKDPVLRGKFLEEFNHLLGKEGFEKLHIRQSAAKNSIMYRIQENKITQQMRALNQRRQEALELEAAQLKWKIDQNLKLAYQLEVLKEAPCNLPVSDPVPALACHSIIDSDRSNSPPPPRPVEPRTPQRAPWPVEPRTPQRAPHAPSPAASHDTPEPITPEKKARHELLQQCPPVEIGRVAMDQLPPPPATEEGWISQPQWNCPSCGHKTALWQKTKKKNKVWARCTRFIHGECKWGQFFLLTTTAHQA